MVVSAFFTLMIGIRSQLLPVWCYPHERRFNQITIHAGNEILADFFGANRCTLANVGAAAKTFVIHSLDHINHPLITLHLALGQIG